MHLFQITQIEEEIWDRKNLRMLNTQEQYVITLKIKDSVNLETPASSNMKEETIDQTEEIKTKETISTQKEGTTKGMVLIKKRKKFFRRNKEHDGGHKRHDQYTEAGSSKPHASSEPGPPKSPKSPQTQLYQ